MNTTAAAKAAISLPSDTEILIERRFAAPPHLVYMAYTSPDLVRRWWVGQRGDMTVCEIDLRVGGRWRYVMRANAGFEVAFNGEYLEIEPNRRIVTTDVFESVPDAPGMSTVTFSPDGDGTVLSTLVRHQSREHRDAHVQSGMEGGMQESMDLLDDLVAGTGPRPYIFITRSFNGTIESVFEAWTTPGPFAWWFGGADTVVEDVVIDLRPGGEWKARMVLGDGSEIPWHGTYLEVDPPRRLALTLADRPGPDFEIVTVDLEEAGGDTVMRFTQTGGNMAEENYRQAEGGWMAFFDALEAGMAELDQPSLRRSHGRLSS